MWVIDLEAPPPRLRGMLARWGVELRAGLYVGSTSAKWRDAIWALVVAELGPHGNAVLISNGPGSQGFLARTAGINRRLVVDVDGMLLAKFLPPPRPLEGVPSEPEPDPDLVDLGEAE
jgi:CRISPR-associated protein Cas2